MKSSKRDWLLYIGLAIVVIIILVGLLTILADSLLINSIFGLILIYGPFIVVSAAIAYIIFTIYDGFPKGLVSRVKLLSAIILALFFGTYIWSLPNLV